MLTPRGPADRRSHSMLEGVTTRLERSSAGLLATRLSIEFATARVDHVPMVAGEDVEHLGGWKKRLRAPPGARITICVMTAVASRAQKRCTAIAGMLSIGSLPSSESSSGYVSPPRISRRRDRRSDPASVRRRPLKGRSPRDGRQRPIRQWVRPEAGTGTDLDGPMIRLHVQHADRAA
jgi:hypothetical protein